MIETILFLLIVMIYLIYKRHAVEKSGLGALIFTALYLSIYLGVPPHIPIKSTYSGQLFGLAPLLSLLLILFPEINSKIPASVMRFSGWFLLLSTGAALVILKIFVW